MRTALLAAALVLSAGAALAQTPPVSAPPASTTPASRAPRGAPTPEMRAARQAMRDACAADIKAFCPDVQAGEGRPGQCFRDHAADLSAPCKDAVAKMRAERRERGGPSAPGA